MVFMLDSVIEVHTFLTKDVLPMRLGDIRIVFTPFSKLDLILLVSCVLSVKLSPSTDTPNTNVFSINHCFADKCSENCKSSQLCGPQSCELFYCSSTFAKVFRGGWGYLRIWAVWFLVSTLEMMSVMVPCSSMM